MCRGASGSAGRTSWSAKPELCDYVSVYGFFLHYINAIFQPGTEDDTVTLRQGPPILVLGGYSYGSMIASHLPSSDVVVDLFKSAEQDSSETEIKRRAEDLSRDARAYLSMHAAQPTQSPGRGRGRGQGMKPRPEVIMGGYDSDAAGKRVSRETSRKSIDAEKIRQSFDKVRRKISSQASSTSTPSSAAVPTEEALMILPEVAYLIVSPILSVTAGLTTMFSKLKFTVRGRDIGPSLDEEFHELTAHPCCCIYGNKDSFTSARKLRRWTEELQSRANSRFTAIEADAGHFWHETAGIVRLRQGLSGFLDGLGLVPSSPRIEDSE